MNAYLLRKVLFYVTIYMIGYWGIGVYSLCASLVICLILLHLNERLKHLRKSPKIEQEPWWLEDSSVSRVQWFNCLLSNIWPQFQSYLQKSHPSYFDVVDISRLNKIFLKNVEFSQISSGTIPPRVDGVKIQAHNNSDVTLDLGIKYCGDANICMKLQLASSQQHATLSLKNLSLIGVLRMKIKFVGDELKIETALLPQPIIDFEFGDGASVLNIPGLYDIVRQIALDKICSVFVFPNCQYYEILSQVSSPVSNDCVRHLDHPEGVLNITLCEARDLVNKDSRLLGQGVSDPYATIDFLADKSLNRYKSFTINDNLNPVWNYLCQTPVETIDSVSDISIKLFDKDDWSKDDPLGNVSVPRSVVKRAAMTKTEQDFWLMLTNTKHGSVRTKVSWSTLSSTPSNHNDDQALLIVQLHSATNILTDTRGKPDCVVSVSVNNTTKVSHKTLANTNPIIEDRLLLLVNNPTVDDLKIDVVDIKNDKLAGSVIMEISQLLSRENLCMLDETFTLVHKGLPTSSSIRMSISLRYLHHTAKLPTPILQTPTAESENIFDIPLSDNQLNEENESTNRDIRKSIKELKDSVKDLQEFMDCKPSQHPKPRVNVPRQGEIKTNGSLPPKIEPPMPPNNPLPKIGVKKSLGKSQSMGSAMNGGSRIKANGSKKESGPRIYLSVKYNKTTSTVSLIIHKVVNLQEITNKNLPNPYVKTYLLENLFSSHKRDVHSKKKTKIKKASFNPVFEDTLEYYIPSYSLGSYKIEVEVCSHKTLVSKMDSLGRCLVDLNSLDKNLSVTTWHSLRQTVVDRRASK